MLNCNICKAELDSVQDLTKHIRQQHDTTEKHYCLEAVAKKDRLTGEQIQYKSLEQYIITDFTGRSNMLKWLKQSDQTTSKNFLENSLLKYAKIKNLEYFPSHFELRTINSLVSAKTYIHFFGEEVYNFISRCGLKTRFDYFSEIATPDLPSTIFEDTREKKPILFGKKTNVEIKKLDYGDYSAGGDIYIERKSLSDMLGTLSSGWARFQNEMDRAKENGHYVVILVDADVNSFLGFNYQSHIHTKASPDFIFKRARDLCRAFPETVQFVFSGGRRESAAIIPVLLGLGKDKCSKIDLQYYKDIKKLDALCG